MPTRRELVQVRDTRLYVEQRGSGFPLILLHGCPGYDHHEFGDYLDSLADQFRLILVDMRSQGRSDPAPESSWTVHEMAAVVSALAAALALDTYFVLGHSFGALVTLTHGIERPGEAAALVVSHGVPSCRFYAEIRAHLALLEPAHVRETVAAAWDRLAVDETHAEMVEPARRELPFHFNDPLDARIDAFRARMVGARFAPRVLQKMSESGYGGFDVESCLSEVAVPTLVLTGRNERTCPVEAAELMAASIPRAELVVFENSGHMSFVEENSAYVRAVRNFLSRRGESDYSPVYNRADAERAPDHRGRGQDRRRSTRRRPVDDPHRDA